MLAAFALTSFVSIRDTTFSSPGLMSTLSIENRLSAFESVLVRRRIIREIIFFIILLIYWFMKYSKIS